MGWSDCQSLLVRLNQTGIGITWLYCRDVAAILLSHPRNCFRATRVNRAAIRLRADEKTSFPADELISLLPEPVSRNEIIWQPGPFSQPRVLLDVEAGSSYRGRPELLEC